MSVHWKYLFDELSCSWGYHFHEIPRILFCSDEFHLRVVKLHEFCLTLYIIYAYKKSFAFHSNKVYIYFCLQITFINIICNNKCQKNIYEKKSQLLSLTKKIQMLKNKCTLIFSQQIFFLGGERGIKKKEFSWRNFFRNNNYLK